jgi:hypothetical protein
MCKTKVSKALLILGVLALAAVPLLGQWHSDFRVTNNPGFSHTSGTGGWNIAADDADVHITWFDYTTSQRIRYFTFPIGSSAETPNGEPVSTSDGLVPVIAIHDGTVAISWYYNPSHPHYLRTRVKNGSWGSIINHGDPGSCQPAIAFDSDGNLHNVCSRYYSGVRVYYQRKNAGFNSYTLPVLVYNPGTGRYAFTPSICLTSDGTIHVSVGRRHDYRLVHAWSTNNGASWNTEYVTGTNQCYIYATSICCDSDDNLYIAYQDYSYPYQVYVVSGTTGSWGSPVNVSNSSAGCYYLSNCCDIYDNIWVAWSDRRGMNYEIYYNKLDAESGSWQGDQPLTSDDGQYSRYSSIAADEHGNVHICWSDNRDGTYEIYYNWYKGSVGGGRDLACTRIIKPLGKITGDPVKPQAVIVNFGGGEDSCYAKCEITGPGSNYDKGNVEGIVYLDPGEEDAVEFPSWTPPGGAGDKYRVEVTVYLWPEKTTDDDDPTNNTKVEYATIESAVQVDPIAVAKPEESSVVDTMTPAATFKSIGTEPAENFYCYCEIVSMVYHTVDYLDSVLVANLDPEETTPIEFAKWICDDDAPYMATFFAAIPGEPDRILLGIEWPVMFHGMPYEAVAESVDALRIEVSGPNPFAGGVLISYSVPEAIPVEVRIYDVTGKAVRTLYDDQLSGEGTLYWDGADDAGRSLPGGLYFIKIATPEFSETAKVVMLR